jgi:hypothetical protein
MAAACCLASIVVAGGCGRSSLDQGFDAFDDEGGPGPGLDAAPDQLTAPPTDAAPPPPPPPPPSCTGDSCPTGCCSEGTCLSGNSASACGSFGLVCQTCVDGFTCDPAARTCVDEQSTCGPANCSGCCDGNLCVPGTLDTACGVEGFECVDCVTAGAVCNDAVGQCMPSPPPPPPPGACAPYGGCPLDANPGTPLGNLKGSCLTADLQSAANSCGGGAHTPACGAFFADEAQQNGPCEVCLSSFDYDFIELTGLFACAAPSINPTCVYQAFCAVDCLRTRCGTCPDPTTAAACESQTAACSMYAQGAACFLAAYATAGGAFCNPGAYPGGDFGLWLQAVGAQYCGP